MTSVLGEIAAQRIVPVIRSATPEDAVSTARAMARAGMRVIELTRSVPHVEQALAELRSDGLLLGVGTITEALQVEAAVAAGARFVVSFGHPAGFVPRARLLGVTAIPGAFTPTEVAACAAAGSDAVKLFPARLAGPGYLAELRAVLPQVALMVTGGIRADDVAGWLAAGALAVGLGSDLGTVAAHGTAEVERRARGALARARETQGTEGRRAPVPAGARP